MPRKARHCNASCIYHVILRSINQQVIFEDSADYYHFINALEEQWIKHGLKIYSFCLMSNHVHLLLKSGDESLSESIRRICDKFVWWYNSKYQRYGSLFAERFKSKVIEDDNNFLAVLRYIHQNPLHAGIESSVGSDYYWNSFSAYSANRWGFVDTQFASSLFPSQAEMIRFFCTDSKEQHMEAFTKPRSDDDVKEIMQSVTGCCTPAQFQALSLTERNNAISLLINEGLSLRQISRLTGVSRYVINKLILIRNLNKT